MGIGSGKGIGIGFPCISLPLNFSCSVFCMCYSLGLMGIRFDPLGAAQAGAGPGQAGRWSMGCDFLVEVARSQREKSHLHIWETGGNRQIFQLYLGPMYGPNPVGEDDAADTGTRGTRNPECAMNVASHRHHGDTNPEADPKQAKMLVLTCPHHQFPFSFGRTLQELLRLSSGWTYIFEICHLDAEEHTSLYMYFVHAHL